MQNTDLLICKDKGVELSTFSLFLRIRNYLNKLCINNIGIQMSVVLRFIFKIQQLDFFGIVFQLI